MDRSCRVTYLKETYMNTARLHALIRKYGDFGVLLVAGYLGLHHLWTKRRLRLFLSILTILFACMILWPNSSLSPEFSPPRLPVPAPISPALACSPEPELEHPAPFSPFAPLPITYHSSPLPKGRFAVLLRDANRIPYQVRIFAPQEKVQVDTDLGSEFSASGEKYYTGSYQIALRRKGAGLHLVERIPLFGEEDTPEADGVFTPWHHRVFVLHSRVRHCPDLLLISQYASSTGDEVRTFFVQQSVLVPVVWHVSSEHTEISQFVNGGWPLQFLHGNIYQTIFFSNAEEYGTHIRTWRFEPQARRFRLLHEEIPSYP